VLVCISVFIPVNQLTILSLIAIAGGLYFIFLGFQVLARKRLLLATRTSRIDSAAIGLVEVTGLATGPHTMTAPITGKPCFLYHTTAWQQRNGKKQEWEKIADETLHVPFFIADSTGQLLIEPIGAELDLLREYCEEYAASSFSSSSSSNREEVPPRISVFLARHGIAPGLRVRIEEHLIRPEDTLFVAGTLTENPGVEVRPFAPRDDGQANQADRDSARNLAEIAGPKIIRLQSGAAPTTQEMGQQAKITAALTRAGISKPEAWSAAGVPYQALAVDENATPAAVGDRAHGEERSSEQSSHEEKSSDFNLTPPLVMMKGANDSAFVISFRSQKESVGALTRKSAALIAGGAAITLLGFYVLLA
jgi:E3 Ubiquitin ligase